MQSIAKSTGLWSVRGPGGCVRVACAAAALALLVLPAAPGTARAQVVPKPPPLNEGRTEPGPVEREQAGIEEKLGEQVPGELRFINAEGHAVQLGDYFGQDKPIVLNLGYFHCPMLCGLVTESLASSLRDLSWTPGDEFEVLTVSFDPEEGPADAAPAKARVIELLGRPEAAAGWHFLTGDQAEIDRLTDAVGFEYVWSERYEEFVHTAAIVILTPDGRVSRYLYGVHYPERTMRLSLVESAEGKVGSVMDEILLYCFRFDAGVGAYTMVAMNMMRLAGVVTVVGLGTAIGVMAAVGARRRKRAAGPYEGDAAASPR
ncbi:MAG: SCO family protein [Phycisphaeraceae bacterium]